MASIFALHLTVLRLENDTWPLYIFKSIQDTGADMFFRSFLSLALHCLPG